MQIEFRKVKHGEINLNGEKYYHPELEKYNNYEVEIISTGDRGIDIYSGNTFVCYIQTVPDGLLPRESKLRAIYYSDPMGDHKTELLLIRDELREAGIRLRIEDVKKFNTEYYDIMFFDWGGMSIGNSMLDRFCERWINDARERPNRIYIMTSTFTANAMEDLRGYSKREIEEFPKNIFLSVTDAIPYLKELLKAE